MKKENSLTDDSITVVLKTAVEINGKEVKKIVIRNPGSGELRDINISQLLILNAGVVCRLAPRVSVLTARHMANMKGYDILRIGLALGDFFQDAS